MVVVVEEAILLHMDGWGVQTGRTSIRGSFVTLNVYYCCKQVFNWLYK